MKHIEVTGPEALRIAMTYLAFTPDQRRLVDLVVDSHNPVPRAQLASLMEITESEVRGLVIRIGHRRNTFRCKHVFLTRDANNPQAYFVPIWVKDTVRAARALYAKTREIASRKRPAESENFEQSTL